MSNMHATVEQHIYTAQYRYTCAIGALQIAAPLVTDHISTSLVSFFPPTPYAGKKLSSPPQKKICICAENADRHMRK